MTGSRARRGQAGSRTPATRRPVARVAVDVSLAHLDRPFDYLVPADLSDAAVPGCRVRVRFAGRLVSGYLLARSAGSDHQGRLAYLHRVVSPEPVLTGEVADLARAVADHYAGTLADVLRLAVPARHARAERAAVPEPAGPPQRPAPGPWQRYPTGTAFLEALAAGRAVRAAWSALPGQTWPEEIARAVGTTAATGRGVVVVVPDAGDLDRVDRAVTEVLGADRHVCLAAELGPAERYRRWLGVARGRVRIALGTRAGMFAPVADLGLVVVWDDGDDLHAERRAPYPHVRDVLALRAHRGGAAALIGGHARTAEMSRLVAAGWARPLAGDRRALRTAAPVIRAASEDELARDEAATTARLPSLALRTARAAVAVGPVLIQVPRRGYLAAIACGRCHTPARCARCAGPLQVGGAGERARCRWCGAAAVDWRCPHCGDGRFRAVVTGTARTAEELGRAFPSVPVHTSGGHAVLTAVPAKSALVVATPGAEPVADGGYAAALLLDGWAMLDRPSLRAAEETLRRWFNAAALVRPAHCGGTVVVAADVGLAAVQALIRWDPAGHADRELAERAELGFPPAVRMATVTGPARAVAELLAAADLPEQAEVLGPVPIADGRPSEGGEDRAADGPDTDGTDRDGGSEWADVGLERVRALVRVPNSAGMSLSRALSVAQSVRSARKDGGGAVRVRVDPVEVA